MMSAVAEPPLVYVLALLFTADGGQVVLMHKTRPAWQAGRVNALGGKLLPGETAIDAARREVREEAGVDVVGWEEFLVWEDPVYRMHAVRAFDDRARGARTAEDQMVFLAEASALLNGLDINASFVSTQSPLGVQMLFATRCLDAYNNGKLDIAHCP